MKRPTIYDVAREAGVSAATVSYVINGRDDQRISDATRKKIWQIVNLLGYSRNRSAYSLAKGGDEYVACATQMSGDLGDAAMYAFIKAFSDYLAPSGKKLSFVGLDCAQEGLNDACALVLIGVESDRFKQIADANMIPVIALDCMVDNPLFFNVNSDFPAIRAAADAKYGEGNYAFLCSGTPNAELEQSVRKIFPQARFLASLGDVRAAADRSEGLPVVIFGEEIAAAFSAFAPDREFTLFSRFPEKKAEAVSRCIQDAIDRTLALQHDIFV